jgi:hypothetical protein
MSMKAERCEPQDRTESTDRDHPIICNKLMGSCPRLAVLVARCKMLNRPIRLRAGRIFGKFYEVADIALTVNTIQLSPRRKTLKRV